MVRPGLFGRLHDAAHWQAQADHMRSLAARAATASLKASLLGLASEHDKLLRRAEERAAQRAAAETALP
jgi:hypothetical protein